MAARKPFCPHRAYPVGSIISWHRVCSYVYSAVGSPACGRGMNSKCGVRDPGPDALFGITTLVIWNFSPVCTSVHLHPIRSMYLAFCFSFRSTVDSTRNCDSFGRLLYAVVCFFRCLRFCKGLFSPGRVPSESGSITFAGACIETTSTFVGTLSACVVVVLCTLCRGTLCRSAFSRCELLSLPVVVGLLASSMRPSSGVGRVATLRC